MGRARRLLVLILSAWLAFAETTRAADVTPDEVRQSIDAGVKYLKSRQQAEGNWSETYPHAMGGTTALVTLALLNAQPGAQDPAVARAVGWLAALPNQSTYVVSLKIAVLAAADPARYRREIQEAANLLSH